MATAIVEQELGLLDNKQALKGMVETAASRKA
jgi:hypothetical protein